MDKENCVVYANSNYRLTKNEIGILWNDKKLNIKWPSKNPIVSSKDKQNFTLEEFTKKFKKNIKM